MPKCIHVCRYVSCVSAVGDLSNELVRHFLIECTQKGVRLKGCPNEPYFGEDTESSESLEQRFPFSSPNS